MRYAALIVLALALGAAAWLALRPDAEPPPGTKAPPAGWGTVEAEGMSFSYPADIGMDYVSTVDWPPSLQVIDEPFSCVEAGEEIARAGRTERVARGDAEYCRTLIFEGAAGSVYRQYAYALSRGQGTALLTFSLRYPQCANYDDPEQTACRTEQETLDVDALADQIARTLKAR